MRDPVVGFAVVGRDDLHQGGEGDHAEQALAQLRGIGVGELLQEQRAFNPPPDAIKLPGQVADESVPLARRHGHEDDHGAGGVTSGGHDHH